MRLAALFSLLFAPAVLAAEVSLDEAFKTALEKNESVRIAEQRLVQAEEVVSQIRGGILPKITGKAEHLIQPLPSVVEAQQFSPSNQTTISVGVVQPLFRGFREFAVLNERRYLRDAEKAVLQRDRNKLFLDVAQAYLNVLSYEKDLSNVREQLEIYDRRSELLQGRAKRGESASNEVLSAQAQQAALDAELTLVQAQLEAARESLQFFSGLPPGTKLVDPEAAEPGKFSLPPLESLLKRVEERPDVKEATARQLSADEGVASAWRAHAPTIDLYGDYFFLRPGFLSDLRWDVGVRATIPIFEGGTTQAAIRESVAKRAGFELQLAQSRRQAVQEIRSMYAQVVARTSHLQKLKRAAELSEKSVKILERDFRRGLVKSIDVQLGLADLNKTKRGYDSARFTAQLELFKLQAATATLPQATSSN